MFLRLIFNQSKPLQNALVDSELLGFWAHWNHHYGILPGPLPFTDKNSTDEAPVTKTLDAAFPAENLPPK